jgi:hypothetical protein
MECLLPVTEAILAARSPPSYRNILELDRKIRLFDIPMSSSSRDSEDPASSMQSFIRSHYSALSMLPQSILTLFGAEV